MSRRSKFASIELSWLSVTVPDLRGEMCTARLFSKGVDRFALKFYLDRVVPINHSRYQKLEILGYPTAKTASLCVPSFFTIPACDGQTDGRICRSIYSARKAMLFAERCKTGALSPRVLT